jgi:cytochrome c553
MKLISAFLILPLIIGSGIASSYAGNSVSLDTPPAALEKWYKPANKRQVWLHTMFRLRREMQAISEYARQNDSSSMKKWIKRLQKDYLKIAYMVPEWESRISPKLLPELEMAAEKGDMIRVSKILNTIRRTCNDCHNRYQPLVTALYRTPHYDNIQLMDINGMAQNFEDNMEDLSESINSILIALDDGHKSIALQASQNLTRQLHNLGDSCSHCHKKDTYPRERILGKTTGQRLETLQINISEGRVKDSQKLLGKIAVTVCARCHNTHRIVYDLRNALLPDE